MLDALVDRQNRHVTGTGQTPVSKSDWRFTSTRGERSEAATTRSTKSGPGRCRLSFGIVLH